MRSYNIVGLDLSLTSPGMACLRVNEDLSYSFTDFDNCKTDSKEEWYVRLNRIVNTTLPFVRKNMPKQIMVENYSFGSPNGRELAGEVQGVVLYSLLDKGYPPERLHRNIAPNARAKFFTGKGRATKKEVVDAVNAFFGLTFKVKDNDIADACVLAFIGYCINHYSQVEPTLNDEQKKILQKIMETTGGFSK